jgi:hypothetical protein
MGLERLQPPTSLSPDKKSADPDATPSTTSEPAYGDDRGQQLPSQDGEVADEAGKADPRSGLAGGVPDKADDRDDPLASVP